MIKHIEQLKKIAEEGQGLRSVVAQDAVEEEEYSMAYLNDAAFNGCMAGSVGRLIYYVDTHRFFEEHYEEIEELRLEYEENQGLPLTIKGDLKNALAWFAYQETAHAILSEIEA